MGFWEIIAFSSIGLFFKKMISDADEAAQERERLQREEEKRKRKKCCFNDGISEEEFCQIVKRSVRYIKRLTDFSINGSIVYGTVRASSGLSEWTFKIDFNDYGHITGKYWMESDNVESNVPTIIAERISSMIYSFPDGFEQSKTLSKYADLNADEEKSGKYDTMWQEMWREIEGVKDSPKKELFKNKVKIFSCIVLFGVLACMTIFVFLWYKEKQKYIDVTVSSTEAVGLDYSQIVKELEEAGFTNIHVEPEYDLEIENIENEDRISRIEIRGEDEFDASSQYPYDARINIFFHTLRNIEVPVSSRVARKMNFAELETVLRNAGFINISIQEKYDLITGWITKDGTVDEISINGDVNFTESSVYRPDVEIIIIYHTFKQNED